MEVALHNLRLFLCASQVTADVRDQLILIGRTPTPDRVALDVLVEEFVGIELGAVPGQEEQPESAGLVRHPSLDGSRPVCRVPVQDQERLPPHLPNHALQEHQSAGQKRLVGYRREQDRLHQ